MSSKKRVITDDVVKTPKLDMLLQPSAKKSKQPDVDEEDARPFVDDDESIDMDGMSTTFSKAAPALPTTAAPPAPSSDGDVDAAADPTMPPMAPGAKKIKRSPFIIYPDQFPTFDPALISLSRDAEKSREGGGEIRYISYVYSYPDKTTGAIRTATKPLLINTPNGMYMPTGFKVWKDDKVTTLFSAGRDWEQNEIMVAFKEMMTKIQKRIIELIVACDPVWNVNNPNTVEEVADRFTDIMFEGINEKSEKKDLYPPSIKATVLTQGKMKTEIFGYAAQPPLPVLIPGEVSAGSSATAVLQLAWVYRKKDGKKWNFSVRVNLYQAVIESGDSSMSVGTCSVAF